ncbi:uncharacterized protein LOC131065051 isoform X2 [Cryptomeria japonica]|uniref:uncharacterized protein LOC131065051 isoform X2 n=1 Tax=Cryptomeria japonica TaxID=3369 RepID=UPI0027DA4B96|nr:uncharacterized protein LOC131065051 isoform X2 [Cryptomeria japonica]
MAVGRLMNFRVILGIRLGVGAFRSSVRAPAHVPFLPTPPPSWTRNPINAFYFLHTNSVKDFCAQDDAKLVRGKKNYKDRSKVNVPSASKIDAQHHKSETKVALFMRSMKEKMKLEELPTTALGLGLAGAIPFVLLTPPLCSILPGTLSTRSLEAQAAYGAVILSFLGGPHWGLAMVRTHAPPHDKVFSINISTFRFIWSIVPSLLAWPALLLSDIPKMCLLIFSFALILSVVEGAKTRYPSFTILTHVGGKSVGKNHY